LIAVGHIFIVQIDLPLKNSTVQGRFFRPGTKKDKAMNPADDWTYETIEVPASVLWKRTLLLTFISVGIGLGTGYLVGRSVPPEKSSALSLRQLASQVRFIPFSDVGAGDNLSVSGDEAPIGMHRPLQPSESDLPSVGKVRPTLLQLEEEPTLASTKG
jgi:hypothetical protein